MTNASIGESPNKNNPNQEAVQIHPSHDLGELKAIFAQGGLTAIADTYISELSDDEIYNDFLANRQPNDEPAIGKAEYIKIHGWKTAKKMATTRLIKDIMQYPADSEDSDQFIDRFNEAIDFIEEVNRPNPDDITFDRYYGKYSDWYRNVRDISAYYGQKQWLGVAIKFCESHPEIDPATIAHAYFDKITATHKLHTTTRTQRSMFTRTNRVLYKILNINDNYDSEEYLKRKLSNSWKDYGDKRGFNDDQIKERFAIELLEAQGGLQDRLNTGELTNLAHFRPNGDAYPAYETLLAVLENCDPEELPKGVTKLMNVGVDSVERIIDVAQNTNVYVARNATIITKLINHLKASNPGGTLSFENYISLANLITPEVAKMSGQKDLTPLDKKAVLQDLSRAIDRITYFIIEDPKREKQEDKTEETLRIAARCASLLIELGSDRKAEQRVVTIGDLIMKFGSGAKEELLKIERARTKKGLPKSQLAASGLYAELRKRRKSASYYSIRPGSGILS